MSMGMPGWNPGQDAALRAQQEANRLQQETSRRMTADAIRNAQEAARMGRGYVVPVRRRTAASRGGRLLAVLVVLALLAAMVWFALQVLDQHQSAVEQPASFPCSAATGCLP